MKWALFKTANGWIVHTDSYFSTGDAGAFHVFNSMESLTNYLLKQSGETQPKKREKNGRFSK